MPTRPNKRSEPGAGNNTLYLAAAAALSTLIVVYVLVSWLASATGAIHADHSGKKPALLSALMTGLFHPTFGFIVAMFFLALLLVGLGVATFLLLHRQKKNTAWTDPLAKEMSSRDDVVEMEEPHARKDAERLGALSTAGLGPALGKSILRHRWLYASWEWTQCWIMGPRAGKTTCVAIPQILETRGPVLTTSNKRDILDATRAPRANLGPVWVQDPQDLANEPALWWWNPLSYATSMERADELAGLWSAAVSAPDARRDAYFDSAACRLLAELIFAAHLADLPVTQLNDWLAQPDEYNNPGDPKNPVSILMRHGEPIVARSLEGTVSLTPRQRDGVYGVAVGMVSFLRSSSILEWITPTPSRPEFSPADFVRSRGTLYLLSKEGAGSARAITAALTVAVARAAEEYAITQPMGRLSSPLLCILDEAANVCRWPDLPNLYSHYGSRGIVLNTILQSWAQGESVWGKDGMTKLWGASNVRCIGRGLADPEHLRGLESLIGPHQVRGTSITTNSGRSSGRSRSESLREESIMTVRDIAALPAGRGVLFSSGHAPVLLELVHMGARRPQNLSPVKPDNPFMGAPPVAPKPQVAPQLTSNVSGGDNPFLLED